MDAATGWWCLLTSWYMGRAVGAPAPLRLRVLKSLSATSTLRSWILGSSSQRAPRTDANSSERSLRPADGLRDRFNTSRKRSPRVALATIRDGFERGTLAGN